MLQKIQLQRVNRIGKLIVGMLNDWLASPIGTANAPFFSAHAHKVGHSSQPVSTAAEVPCYVLCWH